MASEALASGITTDGPWDPGSLVSRYVLMVPLARNERAEVWLAQEASPQGTPPLVAVKRFLKETPHEPVALDDAHVVRTLEQGTHGGSPYLIMEYLDGEGLSVVRRTGQKYNLPVGDALAAQWVSMAALGLAAGSRDAKSPLNGLVHGHLSPQNLFATFEGGLKILNWHQPHAESEGKAAYLSPEQARDERLDPRSDVFALGAILFELVTKTSLYPGKDAAELRELLGGSGALPTPSQRRADVPEDLEPIIIKALFRKKENRYQGPLELHQALEEWLVRSGAAIGPAAAVEYLRTVFARRIHERRQLIESSRSSELTRSAFKRLSQLAPTQGAESESTTSRGVAPTRAAPPRARNRLIAASVATAIALAAVGIGVVARRNPPPVKVAAPSAIASPSPPEAPPAADLPDQEPEAAPIAKPAPSESILGLEFPPEPTPTPAKAPPKAKRPPPPPAEAFGQLSIKTTPWTTVYLGNKKLGDTPLLNIQLPAGRHRLRLVNPEAKLERQVEIDIAPNQTTVQKLTL